MGVENSCEPERLYSEAVEQLARGRLQQACDLFCATVSACPETLDDVAATFGNPKDRERAITVLTRRLRENAGEAAPWALVAHLARDLDRLDESLRAAGRAVEAQPRCATWWYELGRARAALDDWRGACRAFRRCLALDSRHIPARNALRRVGSRRWRALAKSLGRGGAVGRLVRRLATTRLLMEVTEKSRNSAAAHQLRLARALEHDAALAIFPGSPPGLEPENFAKHWANCRCPFWRWFLDRKVDHEIRRVLDVGCGEGYTTEHFVRHGFAVTGLTVNPHERHLCERRGIEVIEGDFHFLPVADESYDLVFSCHSFEHSVSQLFALWEWKRVVRRGGYIMIVVPMPIDQDVRAHFADRYDPQTDSLRFPAAQAGRLGPDEIRTACFTYGTHTHVCVLSYWQITWLFRLAGLELVASAVEDPLACRLLGLEHVNGKRERDPLLTLNGLFLLRKPLGTATATENRNATEDAGDGR